MINLEKLVWDIATAASVSLPPDPEACKECQYHPSNLTFDSAGFVNPHCYMFEELPDTLCMQFKKK
jgi:hypothetical protein